MQRGCFMWTPTSPHFGSQDAMPGSRACVRVRASLAGSGEPASRARFGAPPLFLWPFLVFSSSARPLPGWGCPACGCSCVFFSCAPPLSLAFRVFQLRVPRTLASWSPPPSFVFFPVFPPPPLRVLFLFSCLFFVSFFRFFLLFSSSLSDFFLFSVPWCAGCEVLGWYVLCCGAFCCVLLWALCFARGRCALPLCRSVLPSCASSLCVVACCVARAPWRRAGGVALPRAASDGCRVVLPARPSLCCFARVCFFLCCSGVCWFCPPSPPAGCGVLCCALSCVVSCGAAVCSVFCVVPGVMWRACVGLGSFPVLFGACCAGSCCAVLFLLCFRALLRSLLGFFLPFRGAPGCFCFCALLVRCCAGVPALLLSVRCSVAPAALARVLCCCLLCLPVCCWAWLSSAVSWWVLVAPGVVFRWCAGVCPWVLCCAVWLRVVLPGVVLLCAVLFCFALFGAVARCVGPGALSLVLGPCAFRRCVAAWCCSPLGFVPCASWGVVQCVPCPLRPVRCCCAALLPLGALPPCAVPRGTVLPCVAAVFCPAALFGLFPVFVWFLLLEKPLQNLLKYFFLKIK